jgi:hypothetical protein
MSVAPSDPAISRWSESAAIGDLRGCEGIFNWEHNMTDEIRIEDLTAEHVRRYDRINAVTVSEDDAICAWENPRLAFVSKDLASGTLALATLNVRIDSTREEHVKELHDKAERLFKESSVRR